MVNDLAVQDFVNAIKDTPTDTNTTYQAVVSRIDDEGVVWVNLYGSEKETPTASTSSEVKRGDSVTVQWRNNKLYIGGNYSNPSAGIARVDKAQNTADVAFSAANDAVSEAQRASMAADAAEASAQSAATSASNAMTAAQSAQASADSALVSLANVEDVVGVLEWITAHGTMTANGSTALDPSKVYFVRDNNGDYHVGSYYYSIVAEPKAEDRTNYYTLSVDESVQNYVATHVVVDSYGLWLIPDSGGNKVLIATGAGSSPYNVAGTYIIGKVSGIDTIFAKFTTSGATMNANNNTQIAHLGYGPSSGETGVADAPYYTLGTRKTTTTPYNSASTYAVGDLCVYNNKVYCCNTAITTAEAWDSTHWNLANGTYSLVEGSNNIAAYYNAHAEGQETIALGSRSHAEGAGTIASGADSHAEGLDTIASGSDSHAEGHQTEATNIASHAEGSGTKATGIYGSHAEGSATRATAYSAHSEGSYTIASGNHSHAEGWYSKATADYTHSEGYWCEANGTESHAQNTSTIANGNSQTTLGKFNVADTTSAVIIGNGTSSSVRSNALTIDWNGNVVPAGQVRTSFKSSIAMGSYQATATTVGDLVEEVRFSSGCAGSVSIGTAYTKNGVTIEAGWYNFMYMPHRSGGVNGTASGDNCNYGNMLLFGMNNTYGRFAVRVSSSAIAEVARIYTSIERYTRSSAGGLDWTNTADGDNKVIMKSALAFWNGSYDGATSNLSRCSAGAIIGDNTSIGKTTWSPTSGSSYSNYGGCYYEKYGRVVHVHVGVSGLTAGTSTQIYTLPSGYKPSSTIFAHGTGGSWNNLGYLEINTSGTVTVRSEGTYCGADATFLV